MFENYLDIFLLLYLKLCEIEIIIFYGCNNVCIVYKYYILV